MSESIIQMKEVNKWFGDFQVLKDINLEVKEKQKIVVCGPSGSGKSTLIRCINRLEEHQKGEIIVDGNVLSEKTKEFVALGIAISTKCESCIGLHIEHLIRLGATRKEIVEVLSVCSYMGGGPSIMFSAKALEAFDQLVKK